jgi:S-DNA-T family DNA segregation ATPase FtsK/SpoIIIE
MTAVDERFAAAARAQAAQDEDFWADLMPEAAELVVRSSLGSARMLSRKMRVGHSLACDLLAELHEIGVVGPDDGDGGREVLAGVGELPEVLAQVAQLADPGGTLVGVAGAVEASQPASPPAKEDVGLVSLVKPDASPDTSQPASPEASELVVRPPAELAPLAPATPRGVELVVRARQASARATLWAVDQPVVSRAAAVGRQLPGAAGRLALCTPRGGARAARLTWDWLRDAPSATLLAKHAEAGEGESYARVAQARAGAHLAGRRWLAATLAGLVVMVALAWWAPSAFAGTLAFLVFVAGLALAPRRTIEEVGWGLAGATGLALVVWWQGATLAALIPRPPWWLWWALAGIAVAVFGWLGRHPDRPLVQMPAAAAGKPPPVTAPMIIEAMFRIGVAGMTTTAADKGMRDEIRVRAPGVGRAKHGWQIELELPPGITAGDVGERREELAGALRRPLGCVWPSGGGDHPGHLRIYIGDKPMATAKQTEWPLAAGAPIDLFSPFPLFTDEEGRWVEVTLLGTHAVVAGASGFGKSVTLRQLAVACALDPRVQPHVFDGKISGDLAPLQKVAHSYHEGAEPEDIEAQLSALQAIEREMRRRARFLRDLPPEERSPKVTSALADRYPHLAPIAVLIDEVQEYTEYGIKSNKDDKAIRDAFIASLTRISRLGRSAGIAMVLVSQKPEASVIPTAIMGNCAIRVCHKVTEQNHNDQVLGTSAYKNGYNAALFSQADRGLAWLRAEGDPRVVRSWSAMVDLEVASELVDRAYALRKARGLLTGQAADDGVVDAEVVYDIVEDVERVLRGRGRGKAQWGELVEWLRELRPGQYAGLGEEELSAAVRAAKVRVRDVRSGTAVRKGVHLTDLREHGGDDAWI